MANSSVGITTGSDAQVDVEELVGGDVRQVIVVGDPATVGGVAPVDGTAGLKVNLGADNDVTLATLPDTAAGDLAAMVVDLAALEVLLTGVDADTDAIKTAVEGTLTVSGTVTANLGAVDNAVLDQIEVNTSYGEVVGGGTEATALRVTLANDSTGVLSIDDNGSSLTVDGTVAATQSGAWTVSLSATDNAVLDAIAASVGGTLVVDGSAVTQPVSAASLPLPSGASTAAKQPALGTAGTASTDVLTVQGIASMTALVVDGSGVTQPVSGTVTANLSATDNAVLDAIQAAVETIDNAISGTEMQVDVVGSLPAGTNAIGKLAANSGVDIGDVDVTSVADQYDEYETVAASQTAQVLGSTGATGDFIAGVLVIPASVSPGNVLLLDNATSITVFAGGTDSLLTLHPFFIPLNISSVSGAWKLTTGANVSCVAMGRFT